MRIPGAIVSAIALFALALATASGAPQSTDEPLAVGKPVERQLAGGQSHTFRVHLEANQYFDAVVDQRGIDVVVTLVSPAGVAVVEVDSPNGTAGPEPVTIIAAAAGDYVLTVSSPDPKAPSGNYAVRVLEIRTATPNDAPLIEARAGMRKAADLLAARKPREAIPIAESSVATMEKILGPDHADLAQPLFRLADLYFQVQQFVRAEPLYDRVLAIQRRALAADDVAIGATLNDLASVYTATGREAQAIGLQEQVVAIYEKRLGPDDLELALALNNLAETSRTLGLFDRAAPLYARALAIREKRLGPEHPRVATVLNNQAVLARDRGDYVLSETLLLRSLAMREKALGPDHPDVAQSLANLGDLYRLKGDIDKSEQFTLRALAIKEKVLGPNHPSLALSLNNLAVLYLERGQTDKAAAALERSLAIGEKALGPESPFVAVVLNNLASVYRKTGRFADAGTRMERAIAIEEKAYGPDHPLVANNLTNLGLLYRVQGQLDKSLESYSRALAIREKALGPSNPEVASSLAAVASLCVATGDVPRAVELEQRAGDARERDFAYTLAAGSERQKLLYLDRTADELDQAISLHVMHAKENPEALRIALEAILRRKGRALDAMADTISALRARASADDRRLLDELVATRAVLATTTVRGPGRRKLDDYRAELDALRTKVDALEEQVAARSIAFRVQTAPVSLDAVHAAVPADSALVEYASYRPYDAVRDTFGPPRYVAYVLRHTGAPAWVDLGEAEPIDRAIAAFREAARSPKRFDVRRLGRVLYDLAMRPIVPLAGDAGRIVVAPDGALNVVPFAALVDDKGEYLVTRFELVIVTSGRDLLRFGQRSSALGAPVLVADPAFGDAVAAAATRDGGTGGSLLGEAVFDQLPGTADEARRIERIMPDASVFTRDRATETAIKDVHSPSVLHVATHGFFLRDVGPAANDSRGLVHVAATGAMLDDDSAATFANPLLRSGLALAGANQRTGATNDGILTALETAGLDLWGTELVVLSACDTGVGEVRNGDGVYGLRRALVLAGSESQVMSLWPVSDAATRDLMVRFYRELFKGRGRAEALRRVQLKMLGQRQYAHPFYWAGFIESGAWAPLSDQR
ncbi:MAG TPA: CHAT domain-containing protein [Blastocatellia bacterium]|nr:CHAT domain-containing protein [Blastocatellia bacterium]